MDANVKTIVVCPLTLKVLRMHMLVSSNELFGLFKDVVACAAV